MVFKNFKDSPRRDFIKELYQDLSVYKLEFFIIEISTWRFWRCWQYKHNYIDKYLHIYIPTYVLAFAQPHKNMLKCLFT